MASLVNPIKHLWKKYQFYTNDSKTAKKKTPNSFYEAGIISIPKPEKHNKKTANQ